MRSPDRATSDQIEVLRRMTPAERWAAARDLYWSLRRHKAAFLRHQHPDWTDTEVDAEVRRLFLYART